MTTWVYYNEMAPAEVKIQLSSYLFLPKHPFILRLSFLSKIPRFIRVLSKMEYILIIQNATSKMADVFSSLFRNKWRHHDITSIVKNHLCVSQLPLFYQRPYFFFALSLLWGKFGFHQYIQQYDARLRYRVNLILPQTWNWWVRRCA